MKRNVSKLAVLLCLIAAVSLFAVCGGQSAEAEAEAPAIGHEYASESDPLGAFLQRLEEQLRAASDATGITWDRTETVRAGAAYAGVVIGEEADAGYLRLYKNASNGEKEVLTVGGSWGLESEKLVIVYVRFADQSIAAEAADQVMEAVYSDAVADGLGEAYNGCRDAGELRPSLWSCETATLFIQDGGVYSNIQFFGLREQDDMLYFLDGNEAVLWGFWLEDYVDELPREIIPEQLGGCPVTRVNMLARTNVYGGFQTLSHGSYVAVPSTAEAVGILYMDATYLLPEHVKTLYVTAYSQMQLYGMSILSAGRDTRLVTGSTDVKPAGLGPSIEAYYGTDLARLAEENGWDITYLDPFDGRWEDTEKLITERLDRYEAEDPEAYDALMEGITRDELLQQAKENWEDMMEDAGVLREDECAIYSMLKAGDYSMLESGGGWYSSSAHEPVTETPEESPAEPEEAAAEPEEAAVVASGACGDADSSLTWSLSDSGVLTISGSGRMKDYEPPMFAPSESPSAWEQAGAAPWLYYDLGVGPDGELPDRIERVEFGEGITYIGACAFYSAGIQSIQLPEGLTGIGYSAFGSSALTSVTLPSTLETLGTGAFTGCRITSLTIPAGMQTVGASAFGNSLGGVTSSGWNYIQYRQLEEVSILSRDCVIEDSGRERNKEGDPDLDNIYTLGDPAYTIICGYPGSTAEAFAQKWGYTFRSLDDVPEQTAAGKKLLAVETYGENGSFSGETRYEYNEDGLLVRSCFRSANDTSAEYIYTYDEAGRLLNKRVSSGGEYEADVFVRSYNDDGTLASSSYSGIQDMWNTDEYFYDDSGLAVREKHTIFVGDVPASGYYSFENSVDEQGNLTAIRHTEESTEPRDAVFVYGPDGRMLQGYDEYWLTPITYTYVDNPCFCVRDETGSTGDGYGGMETYTQRVAYILDSAGKEVESFILGTAGEMELTYDENGYISSAKRYFDGWELGETRFIYGDPAEAAAVAVDAPAEDNAAQVQAESGVLTITGDQVNIRSGPGTGYEAIGQVSRGDTLTFTGKSDNWYEVEYNGGTGYIIEDYVILNSAEPAADSAQDTGAMDEAAVAAALDGDWSGFIGALANRYGVVGTAEMSMAADWSSPTVWTGSDLTGLLSATVLDLDADGQQELFTVRMDNYGEDLDGYGNYTDTTHLYLGVYEPGSGEAAAERMLYLLSDVVGSQGANSQFTVFTYDYAGVRYICLDNYATMNETETLVDFFSYDGSQLVFAGAAQYQEYGQGDVYVYRADTEPASFRDFIADPLLNRCDVWQTVMAFSIEAANWQGLGPGEEQTYFKAYVDILAERGLAADQDERVWVNQTGERQAYFGLTAPDVYTAAEGGLRPLALVERHYQYGSEQGDVLLLHRIDCEGSLDSFR